MKITEYTSWNEVETIKDDWLTLEELDPDASFYQNYKVNSTWWETNKDHKDLALLSLEHNGKVIGIFPLFLETRKQGPLSWRELKFLGMGDYRGPLIDSREVQSKRIFLSFFDYIEKEMKYDRLILSNLDGNSELVHFLFSDSKTNKDCKLLVEAPYVKVDQDFSMEKLSQMMPSKTRKYRNRLERNHGLEFIVKNQVTKEDLKEIGDLHSKQQEAMRKNGRTERVSLYDDENTRNFLEELLDDRHHVLFMIKDNLGKLISYRYCYKKNNYYYSWNSGYDYSYRDFRLNNTSLLETFTYLSSLDENIIFDMGAGRYPWKFRWTKNYKNLYIYDIWHEDSSKLLRFLQKVKGFFDE